MKNRTASSGPAVVVTRGGEAFSGRASIDGNWLHFSGRRRIGHGVDGEYWTELVERTWPHREIRVVRWQVAS
jgi:hypothetical protein